MDRGVGLALGVAKFGLLFIGMDVGMPGGLSSLVLQIQAVFTALFAVALLGERPTRVRAAGMAVALAKDRGGRGRRGRLGPADRLRPGRRGGGLLGRLQHPHAQGVAPDALNFMIWVSTVPVLPLLALSLLLEGRSADLAALRSLDWAGAGTVLYVAWGATVFGFGAWGWLLRRHPASTVAPFSLLVPVFGMTSAALFLGESITPLRWCAAALLVGGVALTSVTPRRPSAVPVTESARLPGSRSEGSPVG